MRFTLLLLVIAALPLTAQSLAADVSLQALLDRYGGESKNALLCEQIGVAYTKINDFGKAAEFFGKAVELNPERLPARKNLATVLWFLGKRDEAAVIFRQLEKRIPKDPVPQLYLGLSAYDRKDMAAAAGHFERAGELASQNPETLPMVIDAYLSAGKFVQVTQILEPAAASSDVDARVYRWLAEAYDRQSRPEDAFQAYSKAIDREPRSEDNYLVLAGFYIEHANLSAARDVLTRGLQQLPGSAKLTLEMGLAWAIQGDRERARQSFLDASAADQTWPIPLLALGVSALQDGSAGQAADWFAKAKSVAPKDSRCYYLHAVALNRGGKEQNTTARALEISELRQAIALDPHNVAAHIALAQAETSNGNFAAAENGLREAIRLEPGNATALYKLALLSKRQGKPQEADRLLRAFRESKAKAETEENEFVAILKTVQ